MKSIDNIRIDHTDIVAPLAGAWIEIEAAAKAAARDGVAPLAGAWIEMALLRRLSKKLMVAPLAGAWIEIAPWV